MKRNLIYLIILIIIFFVFYVFFKGLNKVNIYTPNEITNKKIVNFSSKELYTQKNVSFSDILLDNKFTIVNIWSSWCLPCRDEHKYLIKLGQKNNLNMVGINYKDDPTNAKKFIDQFGNPFSLILIDKDGTIAIELGAYGIPETFIINNLEKKIIKKYIGPINDENFNDILNLIK
tara:strand:+ start:735 stop:1259 length:525 start_codon:yes stop_codon:yes gene_type:complete